MSGIVIPDKRTIKPLPGTAFDSARLSENGLCPELKTDADLYLKNL
ncbi:MAG: hypothetical protein KHW62_00230 [Clostridiales bacterium]|nr:hypothetical protein [Clostridiales bacterium]